MKKVFIAAITIIALATSSFASDGNKKASYWVLDQFRLTYINAKDVKWNVTDDFAKASFLLDGVRTEAYYNQQDGSFIGQSKAVSTHDVPADAMKLINAKYYNYTIKEIIEFSNTTDVDFYISLENETEKLILKISRMGDVSIYKSIRN